MAALTSISRHKWSVISYGITVAHVLTLYEVIDYLHRRGMWNPHTTGQKAAMELGYLHVGSMLLAAISAGVAISLEKPRFYGGIAFLLAVFSYVFYVG